MASVSEPGGAQYGAPRKKRSPVKLLVIGGAALVVLATFLFLLLSERGLGPRDPLREGAHTLLSFLQNQGFVLLFMTMAGGYAIAKLAVNGISLGATAGTLLLGLVLSVWASAAHGIEFTLPDFAGALFFNLFMFSVGMKVGPQFLVGLRQGAKDYLALSVLVPVFAMGLMFGMQKLVQMPPGIGVGLFAGANTATPGLGAAKAAFASGAANVSDVEQATGNMATAFAFSYCISTVIFVVMLKALPRLFKRDPVAEGQIFEKEIAPDGTPLPGTPHAFNPGGMPVERRTYVLENPKGDGRTLGELKVAFPRADLEYILRDGKSVPIRDDTVLKLGDEIAVFAQVPVLLEAEGRIGREIYDERIPALDLETVEVVQKNDAILGKKLGDLISNVGHGLYLNAMFRGGERLPIGTEVRIKKGDVFRVTGSPLRLAHLEEAVGPVVRSTFATDTLTLAFGLALGGFIGGLELPIGDIKLSLGSVALLLTGVVFSAVRTRNPALGGPFPEPARQLFEDLGLNVFVAILGLNAGMGVVRAVQSGAILPVLIGSALVGCLPPLVGWVLGQYRLKMNIAELLGAVAGARCSSPGMRAAIETAHSSAPAIAYPVTFAISNVLFTLMTYLFAVVS